MFPTVFPSRELKIAPLGWGSGVSSEAGICANMGLGEGLHPRKEGGVGSMAEEPGPPGGCSLWATASKAPVSLLLPP
jgi:hypothetical protein